MKNFKKLFILVLALLLSFVLISCKNDEETETKTDTETEVTPTVEYVLPKVTDKSFNYVDNRNNSLVEVKSKDLYDTIKAEGSIELLMNYLDKEFLLKDEIASIIDSIDTSDVTENDYNVNSYIGYILFGEFDKKIGKVNLGELFSNGVYQNGVDEYIQLNELTYEEFDTEVALLIARENVVLKMILDNVDDKNSEFYIPEEEFEEYYNEFYKYILNEITLNTTIIAPFYNESIYSSILSLNSLVIKNNKFYTYTGDNYKGPFNDYQDTELVLVEGNELNELQSSIINALSKDSYNLQLNQLSFRETVNNTNFDIAKQAFDLEALEGTLISQPVELDSRIKYILIKYNNNNGTVKEFKDLTSDELKAVKEAYIKEILRTVSSGKLTVLNKYLTEYRVEKQELKFYDRDFAYSYNKNINSTITYLDCLHCDLENKGNAIVSFKNGTETKYILADEYLDYVTKNENKQLKDFVTSTLTLYFYTTTLTSDNNIEPIKAYTTYLKSESNPDSKLELSSLYLDKQKSIKDVTSSNLSSFNNDLSFYLYSKYGYEDVDRITKNEILPTLKKFFKANLLLDFVETTEGDKTTYSIKYFNAYEDEKEDNNRSLESVLEIVDQIVSLDIAYDIVKFNTNMNSYGIKFTFDADQDFVTDDSYDLLEDGVIDTIKAALEPLIIDIASLKTEAEVKDKVNKFIEDLNDVELLNKDDDFASSSYKYQLVQMGTDLTYYNDNKVFDLLTKEEYNRVSKELNNFDFNVLSNDNVLFDYSKDNNAIYMIIALQKSDTKDLDYKYTITEESEGTLNAIYKNSEKEITKDQALFMIYENLLSSVDSSKFIVSSHFSSSKTDNEFKLVLDGFDTLFDARLNEIMNLFVSFEEK